MVAVVVVAVAVVAVVFVVVVAFFMELASVCEGDIFLNAF